MEDPTRVAGRRHLFDPVQRDRGVDWGRHMDELLEWCRRFGEEGMAPEEGGASLGNLSVRTPRGFLITPSRTQLKTELPWDHLVEVVRVEIVSRRDEEFRIHYLGGGAGPEAGGRVPSSDALLHHCVYAARPDVLAVFHGHDPAILAVDDQLGVPCTTEPVPFGTIRDAYGVAQALGPASAVVRRDHGFVTVGRTVEQAGRRALELHRKAVALGSAGAGR